MPDISRIPLRMDCSGLDLVHPIDRMPPGAFPYLFNARVIQEGRIDGRPGYLETITMADSPNSIRRLNDPAMLYASSGYIYVGGGGTNLYAGVESLYAPVDTGYSGLPLSLIPFRPDQSSASWMYVYDANKLVKIRPDGKIREIGVAPPTNAPAIEYGIPAWVQIVDGQSASGWVATGESSGGGVTATVRSAGGTSSISSILYNSGTTGWCCINPNLSSLTYPSWMAGNRMQVSLNSTETVVVRDILNAITATSVAAISYDSGTTGLCSIVLVNTPTGIARNSLIKIDTEIVRVLAVIMAPDGINYSLRCNTASTHAAGSGVTGLVSWYCYTVNAHVAGETISASFIEMSQAAAGVGAANYTGNINASAANGRPIDPANDWLHISLFFSNPSDVTEIDLLISMDSPVNFSFTNPGNSYIFNLTATQLNLAGASSNSWVEIVIPISSATYTGSDPTRNLSTITGVAVQCTSTAACSWGLDWWYLFGTYGQVIQPNSPVGTVYQTRFRDSSTGAASVPGPQDRYELFPLREAVIITPETSNADGVDTIDIYRQGGTVTSPLYVASVGNSPSSPQSYTDGLPDQIVLETNQPPDLAAIQPWPILQLPWSGICEVIGTTVIWKSGTPFNTDLLSNTAISINGSIYLTYGQPKSTTRIELTQDAGYLATANFAIASPTLAAQPLPFAFGPLAGPFAPVIFGLGDPYNGGLLYFSNFNNADTASDANTLELAPPSSNLVSGAVWKGLCFAGNRDQLFCVRYSYLTTIGASNSTSYQWSDVDTPSGIWSRWACCACPLGVAYLGRDGLYIATDSGGANISDAALYPMFPHDGQQAQPIVYGNGSNVIYPVDMTQLQYLRLSYCDEELRFSYRDTVGNWNTLIYQIYKKRWFLNNYNDTINFHYLVENAENLPNSQEILMMAVLPKEWMLAGGDTDAGAPINTVVLTPSADGGDERSQKLYVDTMTMADGTGSMEMVATYNNADFFSSVVNFTLSGVLQQLLQNIASLSDLALWRNVGAKFAWTGGPDGPRLYAWEISSFLQPYLSQFFVTQYITLSFPGWKHMRRSYPALISNSPVLLTIVTQDGRTYGPITIPSTNGQFRIFPQMLPQNIKDLAFAFQLDGQGQSFAFFPSDFVVEVKQWTEDSYIDLAVFKA